MTLEIIGVPSVCEKGREHGLVEVASEIDAANRGRHPKDCDPRNGKLHERKYTMSKLTMTMKSSYVSWKV